MPKEKEPTPLAKAKERAQYIIRRALEEEKAILSKAREYRDDLARPHAQMVGKIRRELATRLTTARRRIRELESAVNEKTQQLLKHEEEIEKRLLTVDHRVRSKVQRDDYARELMAHRTRMARLRERATEIANLVPTHVSGMPYQPAPPALYSASRYPALIPELSGIYFFWNGDTVEYVGQSVNLARRLVLGSHHRMTSQHMISFILVPKEKLDWAECYYMSLYEPRLNFGERRAKYREESIA